MKKLITTAQEVELSNLAKDHADALIAFGADMYRSGMLKGSIVTCIGVLSASAIFSIIEVVKFKKENKNNH